MGNKIIIHLRLLLLILLGNIYFIAVAQKLPKIQHGSIYAPNNIKIDGKITEWNVFQAYNPNNRIYYTIANDNSNLYLAIRGGDEYCSEKMTLGTTFTIKGTKVNENISVTFPTDIEEPVKREPIRNTAHMVKLLRGDTTKEARRKVDSLRLFANNKIQELFKEIDVIGIKEIKESSISIYNNTGIKVALLFNNQAQLVYELAIPLKYLSDAINSGQKFSYHIKMNGIPEKSSTTAFAAPTLKGSVPESYGMNNAFVTFPTDFSGEYTLAKQ